jgi:hypothetical protein
MLQALPPNRISLYLLLLLMALMSSTVMLFLMLTYARYKHRWPRQLIIEGALLLPLTMAPLMMFVIMLLLRLVTAKTAPPLSARDVPIITVVAGLQRRCKKPKRRQTAGIEQLASQRMGRGAATRPSANPAQPLS